MFNSALVAFRNDFDQLAKSAARDADAIGVGSDVLAVMRASGVVATYDALSASVASHQTFANWIEGGLSFITSEGDEPSQDLVDFAAILIGLNGTAGRYLADLAIITAPDA